jgi:RNA polymerase sigma-70 factor (ECF subfamily)
MADRANLERALIRARAGEARGFDALFTTFGASVAGYVRARKVDDPEGIANDVFVRAFRTIDRFDGDIDAFRTWLFTIAHNAAIDDARRRARRFAEAPLEAAPEPATSGDAVDEAVDARLAQERVDAMFALLSPDQRDVLFLRVIGDLSVAQTAQILGKGEEAVKALQRRGLAALRRAISDPGGSTGMTPTVVHPN